MKNDKYKKLEDLIISITSSLNSHLYFCYHNSREGKKFHRETVRQYRKDLNSAIDLFLNTKKNEKK